MYAITQNALRAIVEGMELLPGEAAVESLPAELLLRIRTDQARADRSRLLRDTDWTQMPDAQLSVVQRAEMAVYRQALRDLPEQPGFPDCVWPAAPEV